VEKLISLYEVERMVPLQIKIDHSIDDSTVPEIFAAVRGVVGDIQIVVARASEGCTQITVLVPRQNADETVARFTEQNSVSAVLEVKETFMPPKRSILRGLLLDGPAIDLGRPEGLDRFEKVWRKAVRIESVIRPWRRLRWLASPSIHSSPIARLIADSNDRAYTADLRSRGESFKADVRMTCFTWPLFAAVSLTLGLLALHPFFPFIAVGAGVATGLALSLAGAQVCASALSPIACGAGTIVVFWAFGLAHAFAVGAFRSGGVLSRSNIHNDFFISVTGGIVGLSAPGWLSQMPHPVAIALPIIIASAIAASGWFMTQPANAGPIPETDCRRSVLGGIAGAGMGAGIGIVRLISTVLSHLPFPQPIAFILAFALIGSATFAFTLQLRRAATSKKQVSTVCIVARSYHYLAV
jgi:hypothetical protein